MPYINTIDVNGKIYTVGNLSNGYYTVDLPELKKNDIFILQGNVVDNLESSQPNKPLSAHQGKVLNEKIDTESQKLQDEDSEINKKLDNEISRATNKEAELDTKIQTETKRAKDAEGVLTTNLSTEATRATNKENDLDSKIDTEVSRAKKAESDLNTALTEESTRAQSAENILTKNLNSEITRAKSAEETLTNSINTETSRAKGAENTLTTALTEEVTRATGKEDELNKSIASLKSTVESNKSSSDTSVSNLTAYVDDTFIKKTNIVDNLTTNSSNNVLSAKQGKLLNDNKVDKVSGKGLSTNDYTTVEKNKLSAIEEGANKYVHPTYTVQSSGLYKITVDSTGHVSAINPVTKDDIVSLGIPAQDTIYTLQQASATEIGGVKIGDDYTTGADDVAASTSALKTVYESLLTRIEALEAQNSETKT